MVVLDVVADNLHGTLSVGVGPWENEKIKPVSVGPRIACLGNDRGIPLSRL